MELLELLAEYTELRRNGLTHQQAWEYFAYLHKITQARLLKLIRQQFGDVVAQ